MTSFIPSEHQQAFFSELCSGSRSIVIDQPVLELSDERISPRPSLAAG